MGVSGKDICMPIKAKWQFTFWQQQCTLERAAERTLVGSEHIASKQDERFSLLLLLEKLGIKKNKFETVLIVNSVLTVLFIFLNFAIFENAQARHD